MQLITDRRRAVAAHSLAAGALIVAMLTGCSKPGATQNAAAQWKTTVADNRFSFQMPGQPTASIETADSPLGKLDIKLYQLSVDNATRAYAFTATDLPATLSEPKGEEIEQRLEGAQQGGVNNSKGKLLESKKITVAGYSGRDCLIQLPNTSIARMRIVLVHRTIVVMEVINVNSQDADRYFDSLKLLKDAAPPEPAKPKAKS
jgi:hypothetical protein